MTSGDRSGRARWLFHPVDQELGGRLVSCGCWETTWNLGGQSPQVRGFKELEEGGRSLDKKESSAIYWSEKLL